MTLASGALLVAAFPPWNQPWAAWISFVPWLLLLTRLTLRAAFRWSWLIGFLYFLGSLWWLVHLRAFAGVMAFIGWFLLAAYLALFFGVFGVVARQALIQYPVSNIQLLLVPSLWVALEYARTHALSGFGWNLLGYSQTPWLPLIQSASITGVWGISFTVVLVNALLARGLQVERKHQRKFGVAITLVVGLLFIYGMYSLFVAARRPLHIVVVQGNVPQQEKWDEIYKDDILRRYEGLTDEAAINRPQLIIWPETSVPGYLALDEPLTQRLFELAKRVRIPLLVGAPMAHLEGAAWQMTNSAALINPDGHIMDQYDKLHLVPFGEYVPFERWLPWLRHALPPIGEFVPGSQPTIFQVTDRDGQVRLFGVLICFEDLFPDLARQLVRRGAQWLTVITNDGWFGSSAAYQHAQASIMRAVELRVPVIRAANTGWSGCIDPSGRITGRLQHPSGSELFVEGWVSCTIPVGGTETFYSRWGDWFAWVCVAITLLAVAVRIRPRS